MPRYLVDVKRTEYHRYLVEAPSEDRAMGWAESPPYDDVTLIDTLQDDSTAEFTIKEDESETK